MKDRYRGLAKHVYKTFVSEPQIKLQKLKQELTRDKQTGLLNLRGFNEVVIPQVDLAKRDGFPMLLGYIDMDGLKYVNDNFGHSKGNEAIRLLAGVLRSHFRRKADTLATSYNSLDNKNKPISSLARYGDTSDEFYLALPLSSIENAKLFIEEARLEFEEKYKAEFNGEEVSFSFGLAELGETLVENFDEKRIKNGEIRVKRDNICEMDTILILKNTLQVAEMRMYSDKFKRGNSR